MNLLKRVRSKVFVVLALLGIMIADLNPFFVNAGMEDSTYSHGS